jgi:hypothetical protein
MTDPWKGIVQALVAGALFFVLEYPVTLWLKFYGTSSLAPVILESVLFGILFTVLFRLILRWRRGKPPRSN